MSFLGCVNLAIFVGAANAREECTGPHLCAGLDNNVAHRVGGSSTSIGSLSRHILYQKRILSIEREHAAFRNETLVLFGTRWTINCIF
jgi:hypothetical protein